ncbi:MAG: zf-TFIIB domain-containing protein [Aquificaceae bacterium]|nr:zf-TFIIB domain-containing protein [Aquificaceae bacterium]MDW8294114.1 zf-TFIIB domain-containing protein [Aquificaceae bacterium]
MICPRCGNVELLEMSKYGVMVDVCPSCGGLWLDKGELSKILETLRRAESSLDEELRSLTRENPEVYRKYEEYKYKKKKKSIFGEIFDIFD